VVASTGTWTPTRRGAKREAEQRAAKRNGGKSAETGGDLPFELRGGSKKRTGKRIGGSEGAATRKFSPKEEREEKKILGAMGPKFQTKKYYDSCKLKSTNGAPLCGVES